MQSTQFCNGRKTQTPPFLKTAVKSEELPPSRTNQWHTWNQPVLRAELRSVCHDHRGKLQSSAQDPISRSYASGLLFSCRKYRAEKSPCGVPCLFPPSRYIPAPEIFTSTAQIIPHQCSVISRSTRHSCAALLQWHTHRQGSPGVFFPASLNNQASGLSLTGGHGSPKLYTQPAKALKSL